MNVGASPRGGSWTEALVSNVWAWEASQLSVQDEAVVKSFILDHLGVTIRGAQTETAAVVRRMFGTTRDGGPFAPLVGRCARAPVADAALHNGTAAHSIEFDDLHNASSSHPGSVVIPAALSACCAAGSDAAAFMRAVVVGYEVMCRVGRAVNPGEHYARHFHPTATVGVFGAAAAACAAYGDDEATAVAALGIAASMAAGSMEFLVDGSWTKRIHPGLAARNGLDAAALARAGLVAPRDGVGGPRGFLAAHTASPAPHLLVEGWREWPLELCSTSLKAHTCCRYNQGPIDAVLQLLHERSIPPEQVRRMTVGLPTAAMHLVAEPSDLKRRPRSVVDAQFSAHYGVATALVYGRSGLDEYTEALIADPALHRIMDLVDCVPDTAIDAHYPQQWRAWVTLETVDGTTHRADVIEPRGDPGNPLTVDEVDAKFFALVEPVVDRDRARSLWSAVRRLGVESSFDDLVEALCDPHQAGPIP